MRSARMSTDNNDFVDADQPAGSPLCSTISQSRSAPGGPYQVGARFGPYVLDAYLGSGAFKSVYKARNQEAADRPGTLAIGFPHQQDEEGMIELAKEFAVLSRL